MRGTKCICPSHYLSLYHNEFIVISYELEVTLLKQKILDNLKKRSNIQLIV